MTKRKEYLPKAPKPRQKLGPKKIYGDEPVRTVAMIISESKWAELLARCPKELHYKQSLVLRWAIDELLAK